MLNPRRCQDSQASVGLLRVFSKSSEVGVALPRRQSDSPFDSGNNRRRRYLDPSRLVNTVQLLQFQIVSAPEILLIEARASGFSFAKRVYAARIRLFNASTCTSTCSCLTTTTSEWGKCRDTNTDQSRGDLGSTAECQQRGLGSGVGPLTPIEGVQDHCMPYQGSR